MPEESLKQKTAKGLFWGGMSSGVQQLLGVVFGLILLKNLTPGDYGMVGMLAIFTAIAQTLLESGFTAALTNRTGFKHEDFNSVFWFNVIAGSIIYVILFFSAPLIAKFFHQPALVSLSRVLFLSILFNAIAVAPNAALFKQLMVRQRAIADMSGTVASGIVGITLAVNGYGYWALALQTLVYIMFANVIRFILSPWHPKWKFSFRPMWEMFGFGIKLLFSSVIRNIQDNIFSILLGRFYTKVDVGYYSQGTKWTTMGAQFLTGSISGIAQPVLTQTVGDRERQLHIFRKLLRFIAFISFPCLFGLAFVARDFITLINPEFLPCIPILQMYCISTAFLPMQMLYMTLVISHNRAEIYSVATLVYAVAQILLAYLVLPYGIYWMAFTIVFTNLVYYLTWHFLVQVCLPIRLSDVLKDIAPYLTITLTIFAIVYVVTLNITNLYLLLTLKVVLSIILYVVIMKIAKSSIFAEVLHFFRHKVL